MATTSFFYGGTTAPDQNTVDQLIDDLNNKILAATQAQAAAQAAASAAATSATNAVNAEASLSDLAAFAQNALNQANQAVIDANAALVQAIQAIADSQANVDLSEAWATLLGSTVDGVEFSSKHYAQESSASAAAASTSETNAASSASSASTSATNAASSASSASTSASNASASATAAATSESNAAASESAAATSASSAATSATSASNSATSAATSASNAATSETNAAASASSAATSASNAATSASQASTSASNAATSESNAASSEALAEDWATKTTGTVDGVEFSAKYYAELTASTLSSKANTDGSNATGTWPISIAGNSVTVTDGVYTTGSYTNPTWITSLDYTKITGLGTIVTQDSNNISITGGSIAADSLSATASFTVPVLTTATRPSVTGGGVLIFNSDIGEFEGYNGTAWSSVGGSAITNDTTTATDVFPLFADATSGTAANVYTSNAKLLYKPSTGELKAEALVATNGIVVNSATIAANYTVPTGSNAMSAGPITVNSGITVTVNAGSVWTVV